MMVFHYFIPRCVGRFDSINCSSIYSKKCNSNFGLEEQIHISWNGCLNSGTNSPAEGFSVGYRK